MAVKASATITLTSYRDTQSVTRYYKLQPAGSSAPSKPETKPPSSDWTDSEPACDISKELYFCDLTIFSNGEGEYSKVSKSTSYEAAKEAYNRADNAQKSINNLEIGGRNLFIETDYENIKTQGYVDVRGWYQMSNIKNLIVDDNSEKAAKTAGNSWNIAQYVNVEAGETYTMSCFARLETERSGAKLCFRSDVLQVVDYHFDKDLTTDYQKLTYTWTCGVGGIERIHIRTGNANDVMYVKKIKFEKGNKATDWTPAPEDVDAGISNAQTKANEAADIAGSKVGISTYYSDKEILDNAIDGINTAIDDINSTTDNLSSAISKELVRNGFAEFTNDPKLTLGKTTSAWKVVVTNDGIFLQKSSNDIASLSKETSSEETTLRADNARLANVKFRSANGGGKLGIVAQSNGHVSLKEI